VSEAVVNLVSVEKMLRHFSTLQRTPYFLSRGDSTTYDHAVTRGALAEDLQLFNAGSDMFRISTIDTQRERRLVIEGTLVRPWVDELRRTWSNSGDALEGRSLVIDLNNTTVISREGASAIFDMMREGAKFSCGGVLTRHLLKELAHRCHARLNDVLNERCAEK